MTPLARRAVNGLVTFQVALALMLLLPAWTLWYLEAWVYWIVFTIAVTAITSYFLAHDPALVARRLAVGPAAERERSQKIIQTFTSVLFVALFIIPGLDRRFSWSPPYSWAWKAAANALVAAGFLIMFLAFRANSYAAGVVEIAPGQQVIATGPYARVRHPMYFGAVLMFLVTPVALGSFWALAPAAGLVAAIVARLRDEERFLSAHLSGYSSYRQRVPFRLIPGIW